MAENYGTTDLFSRVIQQDDIGGICALYPPVDNLDCARPGYTAAALDEDACDEAAATPDGKPNGGCSVAPDRALNSGWTWFVAFAAAALVVARRHTTFSRIPWKEC